MSPLLSVFCINMLNATKVCVNDCLGGFYVQWWYQSTWWTWRKLKFHPEQKKKHQC